MSYLHGTTQSPGSVGAVLACPLREMLAKDVGREEVVSSLPDDNTTNTSKKNILVINF